MTVADPEILTTAAVTLDGDTVAALCDHVRDREVIVCVASHGRSGLGRRLIGSTAEAFLRASPVPVIIVGPNAEPQSATIGRASRRREWLVTFSSISLTVVGRVTVAAWA